MNILLKDKLRFSAWHFFISISIVLTLFLILYYVVYTPHIMRLEGGGEIAIIIFFVDVSLGPLMTFILFRRGKKGLKLDLSLVALIQILALGYGVWILYIERPLFLAYVVEHFEIMPANDIDITQLRENGLKPGFFSGPKVVYVKPAEGEKAHKIMLDALRGGKDVQFYPEYYRNFRNNLPAVISKNMAKNWSIDKVVRDRPDYRHNIQKAIDQSGKSPDQLLLIPIKGHAKERTVLIDKQNGSIISYIDIRLW